jgi:hypothetical protein
MPSRVRFRLPVLFLAVCAMWAQPVIATAQAVPELPRATVDTSPPAPPARTIALDAGADLQAALDAAVPGDMISLAAGATFTGNFILPAKSETGWIVIRSSAPDASLPPLGTRITPAHGAALPKVVSPNASPAIATAPGAHHYWLSAIEVTVAAAVAGNNRPDPSRHRRPDCAGAGAARHRAGSLVRPRNRNGQPAGVPSRSTAPRRPSSTRISRMRTIRRAMRKRSPAGTDPGPTRSRTTTSRARVRT